MIYISVELLELIRQESEKAYPNECCGILFGQMDEKERKYARELVPVENSFEGKEQYHRFLIPPEVMRRAELRARKKKQDIVGFYHSHPDHPAIASEYDRNHALPVYSYLITSVAEGTMEDYRSWELQMEGDGYVFFPEKIVQTGGRK